MRLEGASTQLSIEAGWWPVKSSTVAFGFQPGGAVETPLPPLRCGDVWMTATGPNGEHCEGQGAMPVRATFRAGADNVLDCRVVP